MIATKQLARVGVSVGRIESAKVWNRLGLGFALALSAALNLWNLAQNGYGNTYYAVAVQSMMQSWTNFFFGSYDAGGFITVDKPPVALMMQAISAKIFGFSGLALLVPEALAGVASVGIVYYLVRKVWGPLAGFVAALSLAISPIAVAIERSNNTDTWLVFFLLLAAWALSIATEKGKLGALLGAMALVGVAFNVKMLAAWIVLPGFYLLYFVGAPVSWARRIVHLALATVVVLAVSLSWAVVTDYVVPADARPWIGGSQTNSVLELALGYNGFGRVTGQGEGFGGGGGRGGFNGGSQTPPTDGGRGGFQGGQPGGNFGGGPGGQGGAGGSFGTGEPGALRLFNSALIDQWSWLIPLALLGLPVALLGVRRGTLKDTLTNPKLHSLLLWGGWLACYGVVYSMAAGIFHTYYVVMLAPPAAALVGAGVSSMWLAYRRGGWQGWILPVALLATAVYQVAILSAYPQWAAWLAPLLIGGTLLAAGGLVAARLMQLQRGSWRRLAPALLAVGLLAAAISPFAWATTTVAAAGNATLPEAGPAGSDSFGGGRGGFGGGDFGGGANSALVSYLEANRDGYFYLLAVSSANEASSIALSTGEPVLAMGGFSGSDPAMTVEKLQAMVANKQLRFVMGASGSVSGWLQSNCSAVDTSQFGGTGGFGGFGGGRVGNSTLYDCAAQ